MIRVDRVNCTYVRTYVCWKQWIPSISTDRIDSSTSCNGMSVGIAHSQQVCLLWFSLTACVGVRVSSKWIFYSPDVSNIVRRVIRSHDLLQSQIKNTQSKWLIIWHWTKNMNVYILHEFIVHRNIPFPTDICRSLKMKNYIK